MHMHMYHVHVHVHTCNMCMLYMTYMHMSHVASAPARPPAVGVWGVSSMSRDSTEVSISTNTSRGHGVACVAVDAVSSEASYSCSVVHHFVVG